VTTLKHFLTNNFEHARTGFARLDGGSPAVNVVVSERALREFCLPPFKAAIEAGAGSLMGCASTSSSVTFSSPAPAGRRPYRRAGPI
jgi:beta-glucosidase-like glycosyl hydrolase